MSEVVTRYAPSPTGNPHVGNIRTALFSYLYAKSKGGKFLLRIEDTDRARFVPESLGYIEESLKWLGLEYDGEKVFQSDRLPIYQKYAAELIEKGLAYKCYCSSERLENLRSEQQAKKLAPGYDGHCRNLCKEERVGREKSGEPFVIRFIMPDAGKAKWDDLVRGSLEIEYGIQEDFVMLKSDGWPTYNFANVIDDHEMKVTDVIRGEEFIPSTPKHLALYDALGWKKPTFAHLPVILGPDKAKLSKRHGDTAILDYRDKGYLPEAMVNFLALLGWNPGTEQEIFNLPELAKAFTPDRIGKSPAVFDLEKLNWINGAYLRSLIPKELTKLLLEFDPKLSTIDPHLLEKMAIVEQSRLKTLSEFAENTSFYLKLPKYASDILVFKKSTPEATKMGLEATLDVLAKADANSWEKADVDHANMVLGGIVERNKLTNADVFWPVRVALSGLEKSPSPAELLWVLGKDESIKRLKKALETLSGKE